MCVLYTCTDELTHHTHTEQILEMFYGSSFPQIHFYLKNYSRIIGMFASFKYLHIFTQTCIYTFGIKLIPH